MNPRRVLGSVIVLLISLVALIATGQPADSEKKETETQTLSPEAGSSETPEESEESDDLGGPPPKTTARSGKERPSPLNPAENEFPKPGTSSPPPDFDKLLGEIAALRSRVAALTTTMFASKLRVSVETEGDDSRISKLSITLDDGVVYTAPPRFSAEDEKVVYKHAVAPGHHVLGVEVERYDARGKEYQTWQSSKFSVIVPEGKTLAALISLEDDSAMAEDFPDDKDGEYELNTKLRAEVVE